jgi:hypothetical protein
MTSEDDLPVEDDLPLPEPSGDLEPPVRHPPTAVGAGASSPEPRPPSLVRVASQHVPTLVALFERGITLALDALDAAGDAVAERLGLRSGGAPPPAPPSA